jgi:methionine salvage enolase-phosphatase E1
MDLYISEYLENNNINKAIELVKKYAELNNKTANKKLLKEDIVNCILQYISKNNKNNDYKDLSIYVDNALRFQQTQFQNTILKNCN